MMPYKSTFIKLFSFLLKKHLVEQFGKEVTKSTLKKAPSRSLFYNFYIKFCCSGKLISGKIYYNN